jgi:general secretion pathway protein M
MSALWQRLSSREKIMVSVAALFVVSALIYGILLRPAMEKGKRLRGMAVRKQAELTRFVELSSRYQELETALSRLENRVSNRKGGTSLLADLEAKAKELNLQDNIASMKPFTTQLDTGLVESSVEMRLEKLSLRGLVDLLQRVEGSGSLAVTRKLRVKSRFDDPQLLDVSILVSTLEPK